MCVLEKREVRERERGGGGRGGGKGGERVGRTEEEERQTDRQRKRQTERETDRDGDREKASVRKKRRQQTICEGTLLVTKELQEARP